MAMLDPTNDAYRQDYPVKFPGINPGTFTPSPMQETINRLLQFKKEMDKQKVDTKITYSDGAAWDKGLAVGGGYVNVDAATIRTPFIMTPTRTKGELKEEILSELARRHGFEYSLNNVSNQVILYKKPGRRTHKWAIDMAFWLSLSPSKTIEVIEEWLVKVAETDQGLQPAKKITIPKAWRVQKDDVL